MSFFTAVLPPEPNRTLQLSNLLYHSTLICITWDLSLRTCYMHRSIQMISCVKYLDADYLYLDSSLNFTILHHRVLDVKVLGASYKVLAYQLLTYL